MVVIAAEIGCENPLQIEDASSCLLGRLIQYRVRCCACKTGRCRKSYASRRWGLLRTFIDNNYIVLYGRRIPYIFIFFYYVNAIIVGAHIAPVMIPVAVIVINVVPLPLVVDCLDQLSYDKSSLFILLLMLTSFLLMPREKIT